MRLAPRPALTEWRIAVAPLLRLRPIRPTSPATSFRQTAMGPATIAEPQVIRTYSRDGRLTIPLGRPFSSLAYRSTLRVPPFWELGLSPTATVATWASLVPPPA